MLQALKRVGLLAIVGNAIFWLDQLAKRLVVERLALGQSWEPIPAISGFIRITRSSNTGAAFGMFPWASNFFLVLAPITVLIFMLSYPKLPAYAWLSRWGIALISGGALSNAIDRIRLGYVVDYVHVQLTPNFANISNFADHAVTIGVALLLLDQWLIERREAEARKGKPSIFLAYEPHIEISDDGTPIAESPDDVLEPFKLSGSTDLIATEPDDSLEITGLSDRSLR